MKTALQAALDEYEQLVQKLASASPAELSMLGRRQAELAPLATKIQKLESLEREIAGNQTLVNNPDEAIAAMAHEEVKLLQVEASQLEAEIDTLMLPKEPNDTCDVVLEMRAGAGGDEATLFVAELFRAYAKFSEMQNWTIHVLSSSRSEVGGLKEIICEVKKGSSASEAPYSLLKYESGVHRVQRVPATEKQGRVHTSTITVAVLPELAEKDYQIDAKDLKIEATTSSGHGGQSVNTTYSAIRIMHLPTGITAQCQDERSQAQNKEKALAVIRARVAAHYREIEAKKLTDARRSQIGTGDRSEKIRTYNFPQDRVTDHRINQNFGQINLIMEGRLEPLFLALQTAEIELRKQSLLT